jgi:hypothetical protein
MKKTLCVALTCLLPCTSVGSLLAQSQAAGTIKGVVLPGTGVVSGVVASSSGRRVSGMAMQLVNPAGLVVGKAVTTRDGEYTFTPVSYDVYTVQCMDDDKVIGTAGVTLTAPMHAVDMVCTSDALFWQKWGLLAGLGAAAAAIGAVGVVAARGDASGSR